MSREVKKMKITGIEQNEDIGLIFLDEEPFVIKVDFEHFRYIIWREGGNLIGRTVLHRHNVEYGDPIEFITEPNGEKRVDVITYYGFIRMGGWALFNKRTRRNPDK
jgi:hypothetical protein